MLSAADIVRLDAQAVRASIGVVSLAGIAEPGPADAVRGLDAGRPARAYDGAA